MEYREAQNILSQTLTRMQTAPNKSAEDLSIIEALKLAVISFNRRLGIVPFTEQFGESGFGSNFCKQVICPYCGKPLITYLNNAIVQGAKTPCCPECGQVIDYGDN